MGRDVVVVVVVFVVVLNVLVYLVYVLYGEAIIFRYCLCCVPFCLFIVKVQG